jgi:hypothetical protein
MEANIKSKRIKAMIIIFSHMCKENDVEGKGWELKSTTDRKSAYFG